MTREADWKGKHEQRFSWRKLRREWGRMCYETNYAGETLDAWWEPDAHLNQPPGTSRLNEG